MKTFFTLLILLNFISITYGQHGISGKYHNHFGDHLILNSDSTYVYNHHFDLSSSWSNGKWKIKNDTIYFIYIPVYDTYNDTLITLKNKTEFIKGDSLVLSDDNKPGRITYMDAISSKISSGGQNRDPNPSKLFYKSEKLYEIGQNGRLIVRKRKEFWSQKKFKPYYIKDRNK